MNEPLGYFDHGRHELLEFVPASAVHILDIGCGCGCFGKVIKQKQKSIIVGIDIARKAIIQARKNIDYTIHADLGAFDFSTLKTDFDLIIFADILEHMRDPLDLFIRATSRLKHDGQVICSVPNIAHPQIINELHKGMFRYTEAGILDKTHLRFFSQTSIFQFFIKAGFKITELRPYPSPQNPQQFHIVAKKILEIDTKKEITLIMPTLNCLEYTKLAIKSIRENTKTPISIIVVDNNSTDGTQKWLRAQHDIYHIENTTNQGFACSNNLALSCVTAPYFLLSNNDVIVTPGAIDKMLYQIKSGTNIAILSAMSNNISGPQKISNASYSTTQELYDFSNSLPYISPATITIHPRIVFFFTLFNSRLLHDIGFLDENFTLGNFEDDDYCMRATLCGNKLAYDTSIFIHHYGSTSWKQNNIDYNYYMEKNYNYLLNKYKLKATI